MSRPVRSCILLAAVLAGCQASPDSQRFSPTDSAGVRIASNTWTSVDDVPVWTLEADPIFSVGDPAPSEEYELFQTYYGRSFSDGRVAATVGLREVRIYDPQGGHLITFGRSGEGPGEFSFLWDTHPIGDTAVLALDPGNRRASLFHAETGELLTNHPLPLFSNPNGVQPLANHWYVGVLPEQPADPADFAQARRWLARYSPLDGSTDTLAILEREGEAPSPDPQIYPYFEPSYASAAAGELSWGGWEGRYEIRRYDASGALDMILRSTREGDPVTEEMKETVSSGMTEGGLTRQLVFPDHLPPYDKLLGTPDGGLWVRHYPSELEDTHQWDIFDTDGRLIGYIETPKVIRLCEIGDDYIMGIFRNELDVESIRKYRFVRGSDP